MKIFILLLTPFLLFASGQMMSHYDYLYFNSLDKQPFKPKNEKSRMHSIVKVSYDSVKKSVEDLTGEPPISIELTTDQRYLIYKTKTKNYLVTTNALDGTVIKKELK